MKQILFVPPLTGQPVSGGMIRSVFFGDHRDGIAVLISHDVGVAPAGPLDQPKVWLDPRTAVLACRYAERTTVVFRRGCHSAVVEQVTVPVS